MGRDDLSRIAKVFHDRSKRAYEVTQQCFIMGCDDNPISAHSIANSRLLRTIADDGEVMYLSPGRMNADGRLAMVPTGRRKASAFPGFCEKHDKVFEPIDNQDYAAGDQKMEYLFAMRASAREYTVRRAMVENHRQLVRDLEAGESEDLPGASDDVVDLLREFGRGFEKGLEDAEEDREFFNATFARKRFWKVTTEVIEIPGEIPVVASSMFKLELGPDGGVINDPADLAAKQWPVYLTIFPQAGKTFALLSWHRSHANQHASVVGVSRWPDHRKQVAVSNVLTAYAENFAANPTFWSNLPGPTRARFEEYFGMSMTVPLVPFVYDDDYSLFP